MRAILVVLIAVAGIALSQSAAALESGATCDADGGCVVGDHQAGARQPPAPNAGARQLTATARL